VLVLFNVALAFTCYTTRVKPAINPSPCASTALLQRLDRIQVSNNYTNTPLEQLYPCDIITNLLPSVNPRIPIPTHCTRTIGTPTCFLQAPQRARDREEQDQIGARIEQREHGTQ
jgi:hypothetical protein